MDPRVSGSLLVKAFQVGRETGFWRRFGKQPDLFGNFTTSKLMVTSVFCNPNGLPSAFCLFPADAEFTGLAPGLAQWRALEVHLWLSDG